MSLSVMQCLLKASLTPQRYLMHVSVPMLRNFNEGLLIAHCQICSSLGIPLGNEARCFYDLSVKLRMSNNRVDSQHNFYHGVMLLTNNDEEAIGMIASCLHNYYDENINMFVDSYSVDKLICIDMRELWNAILERPAMYIQPVSFYNISAFIRGMTERIVTAGDKIAVTPDITKLNEYVLRQLGCDDVSIGWDRYMIADYCSSDDYCVKKSFEILREWISIQE